MKPRTLVVSAVAAISLTACVGLLVTIGSSNEFGAPDQVKAGASHTQPAAEPSRTGIPITERRLAVAPRVPRSSLKSTLPANDLGIPATDLLAARQLADEMAANMERHLSTMQDAGYGQQSRTIDNPSRKLGLRLGVDPAVSEKMGGILAADRARRIEGRIAAEKARLERSNEVLEGDRDNYVSYLALESMKSRGVALSEAQEEFHNRFRQSKEPGEAAEAGADNQEWYEKPDVVDAMRQHLSPEQQTELVKFVDEQRTREHERQTMHAYMRSSAIADRLALDEVDRTTLYEYLRENPHASTSELAGILAPELRELLPPGL